MDTGSGSFSGAGLSGADIEAIKRDIAELKTSTATVGANVSSITPVEGGVYNVQGTEKIINIVNAKPATDLSAITVVLPQARVGQRLFFHCSRQVEMVTFTMPGGSVDNNMVMLLPGDSVDFTYSDTNNWARGTV